ncbi:MAG: hypothetical protein JWM95_4302 [Gemmatimonadetes bacterium]|nr:hypothetical protein [Gemmatimonadota bacterium]
MNNDELDEMLRDAAQTYNLPPAPPREAMWEAIARAREASTIVPIMSVRRAPRWLVRAAGVAAVLMVGIAIGRGMRDTPVVVGPVASALLAVPAVQPALPAPIVSKAQDEPAPTLRTGRQVAAVHPRTTRESAAAGDLASDQTAYRLAVVEHLTRTEVLLTSFRARERSGSEAKMDAQFSALSRDLLSTTRLLLAVHRADDPTMTRLLQDLEYVLMQISQYAADGRRVDLDAINQSLDRRNVLPKLRSTIPAGVSTSTSTES